jgi:Family of unknown function (DUF5946)
MNCPECGAYNLACEARFHEFLGLEFSDPDYGAVHHLTVASYMLQHSSKLTGDGWKHMRFLLKEFLMENRSPAFIRRQNRDLVDGGKRNFKISSKGGQPVINKVVWQKTILDVRADNATTYCEDVIAWARAVLKESESLSIN